VTNTRLSTGVQLSAIENSCSIKVPETHRERHCSSHFWEPILDKERRVFRLLQKMVLNKIQVRMPCLPCGGDDELRKILEILYLHFQDKQNLLPSASSLKVANSSRVKGNLDGQPKAQIAIQHVAFAISA
jgi:hypothetical protein